MHKVAPPPTFPPPYLGSLRSTRGQAPAPPLNNKTPAVASDRLVYAPPCVCTAFCVYAPPTPHTPPPYPQHPNCKVGEGGGDFVRYMENTHTQSAFGNASRSMQYIHGILK